jgi:hypothetical protein
VAVDFSTVLYLHTQDFFSRAITITPTASNPGAPAYTVRGIYTTRPIDIMVEVGMAMVSDQQTIIDIRDNEFFDAGHLLPIQGDLVDVPAEGNIPVAGTFEITDTDSNGGGETTLSVRKWGPAAP